MVIYLFMLQKSTQLICATLWHDYRVSYRNNKRTDCHPLEANTPLLLLFTFFDSCLLRFSIKKFQAPSSISFQIVCKPSSTLFNIQTSSLSTLNWQNSTSPRKPLFTSVDRVDNELKVMEGTYVSSFKVYRFFCVKSLPIYWILVSKSYWDVWTLTLSLLFAIPLSSQLNE